MTSLDQSTMAAQSSASKLGTSPISSRPDLSQQQSHSLIRPIRTSPAAAAAAASAPVSDLETSRGLSQETKLLARQVLHPDQDPESNNPSHPFNRSMDWLLGAVTECENPEPLTTDRERLVEGVKLTCDKHTETSKKSPERHIDGHGKDMHTMPEEVVDIWALPQMEKPAT